jgi:predicted alpha/beta hydrolase family esterase
MHRRRVIIIPGNGSGCEAANFYPSLASSLRAGGFDAVLRDMPDPNVARSSIWLPFIIESLGADSESVLVGHSSGAVAALRLAEKNRYYAVVVVSVTDNDLGDDNERASGYYDAPWDWSAMRRNVQHLIMFASDDDPFIPIAVQRRVARELESAGLGSVASGAFEYVELSKRSHFFGRKQPEIESRVAFLAGAGADA